MAWLLGQPGDSPFLGGELPVELQAADGCQPAANVASFRHAFRHQLMSGKQGRWVEFFARPVELSGHPGCRLGPAKAVASTGPQEIRQLAGPAVSQPGLQV